MSNFNQFLTERKYIKNISPATVQWYEDIFTQFAECRSAIVSNTAEGNLGGDIFTSGSGCTLADSVFNGSSKCRRGSCDKGSTEFFAPNGALTVLRPTQV